MYPTKDLLFQQKNRIFFYSGVLNMSMFRFHSKARVKWSHSDRLAVDPSSLFYYHSFCETIIVHHSPCDSVCSAR